MAEKVTSPHISQITDYLYLSAFPRGEHVAEIVSLGVRLVLSMHWMRPTKMLGKPPVELLWLPTCVLIGMGYSAEQAMQLIKEKRAVADPDARHIQNRIRKFLHLAFVAVW